MKPEEAVDFFTKQAERASNGFSVATSTGNLQLAAMNTRQLFKCSLMKGLIKWRQGRDARTDLNSAVDAVLNGIEFLVRTNLPFDIALNLPIERASLLAYLLDRDEMFSFESDAIESADRWLDWVISSVARDIESVGSASPWLVKLKDSKNSGLATQTYQVYFEILSLGLSGQNLRNPHEFFP